MKIIKISFQITLIFFVCMLSCFKIMGATVTSTSSGGNWNVGATWTGNAAPASGDIVVIAGPVTLNVAATVASITINASQTFTGSTNTLTINNAGTFTNNGTFTSNTGTVSFLGSGTVSGTCGFYNVTIAGGVDFGASSTINGILQLNNGSSVNTNAPIYASGSTLKMNNGFTFGRGTEWGAVTSGKGYPYNLQISGSTQYQFTNATNTAQIAGSLTIDDGSQFNMSTTTARTAAVIILGNVTVGGGTSGIMTLSTSAGGDLKIGGNLTRGIGSTWTNNSRSVFFNAATGDQTISFTGGGTQQFDFFVIDKATSGNVVLSSSPATSAQIQSTAGDVFIIQNTGGLDLNGQTFTLGCTGGCNGGNIKMDGTGATAKTITSSIAGGVFRIQGNASGTLNKTVTSANSGTLTFPTNSILAINNCQLNPGAALTTINGELDIESGGDNITNASTYGTGSTLKFKTGSVFILTTGGGSQQTWVTGASGAGVPYHVTIDGAAVAGSGVRINAGVTQTCRGNLTITGNGVLDLNATNAPNNILKVAGNWTGSTTESFTPNTNKVVFNGAAAQTLTKTSGTETFYDMEIANTSGDLTLAASSAVTITDVLTFTSGNIILGANTIYFSKTSAGSATAGTASSTSHIVTNSTGTCKKYMDVPPGGQQGSFVFPIGPTTSSYNPVQFDNSGAAVAADNAARVVVGVPSDIVDPVDFVNRTWFMTTSNGTTANGDIYLYWSTADENAAIGSVRGTVKVYHKPTTTWQAETSTGGNVANNPTAQPAGGWYKRAGAITVFSPFIVGTALALPIDLVSFSGKATKGGNLLEWTTASEVNNDYFTIERAVKNLDFKFTGMVKGAGNSTRALTYEYLDNVEEALHNELSYYKLKQTDFDGKTSYSKEIAVHRAGNNCFDLTNYFVDEKNELHLNIKATNAKPVTIEVTDALGRVLIAHTGMNVDGVLVFQLPEEYGRQLLLLKIACDQQVIVRKFYY